jgi:MFS family permease
MVPMVLVVMNVVYALAAYPAGAFSDRTNRLTVLIIGFAMLMPARVKLTRWRPSPTNP